MEPGDQAQQNKKAGPIVGIVIIVVILVVGGLYLWGERIKNPFGEQSAEEIMSSPDNALDMLQTQGTSNEVNAIEEDLGATNLNDLDKEVQDIDKELNAF